MREYQRYVLTSESDVVGRVNLICANEEDARKRAALLVERDPSELWEWPRLIARFEPNQ